MATKDHTIAFVPLTTGLALWLAATALMLEDAWRAGHWDAQHLAVPVLTGATCIAGCLSHMRLARFRLLSGLGLAALAMFGSALCVLNSLSRTAADRDNKIAVAMAANRVLVDRIDDLTRARAELHRECKARGPRCKEWEGRVDALQAETKSMLAVAVDPRADAIGRLAALVGFEAENAKAIVRAIEPAALPVFLELGAIVLLGVSFGSRKVATVLTPETISQPFEAIEAKTFGKDEALADLQRLRKAGSGRYLADRWNVSEGTVSKWMQAWQAAGDVSRERVGKDMRAVATVPAGRRLAAPKG